MRLVALDLETTGLDPQKDQILEIGMVCFESDTGEIVGEFETLVGHERYHGDGYALAMNVGILRRLNAGLGVSQETAKRLMDEQLGRWDFADKPTAVGFNVKSFDMAFLDAARFPRFQRRAVEIGTLLMPAFRSATPVSSKDFTAREGGEVAHTALADCHMARRAYMLAMGIGAK